jgi:hypothetical protein
MNHLSPTARCKLWVRFFRFAGALRVRGRERLFWLRFGHFFRTIVKPIPLTRRFVFFWRVWAVGLFTFRRFFEYYYFCSRARLWRKNLKISKYSRESENVVDGGDTHTLPPSFRHVDGPQFKLFDTWTWESLSTPPEFLNVTFRSNRGGNELLTRTGFHQEQKGEPPDPSTVAEVDGRQLEFWRKLEPRSKNANFDFVFKLRRYFCETPGPWQPSKVLPITLTLEKNHK